MAVTTTWNSAAKAHRGAAHADDKVHDCGGDVGSGCVGVAAGDEGRGAGGGRDEHITARSQTRAQATSADVEASTPLSGRCPVLPSSPLESLQQSASSRSATT